MACGPLDIVEPDGNTVRSLVEVELYICFAFFNRDLKPSNIFLAEDGSISVGKFFSSLHHPVNQIYLII